MYTSRYLQRLPTWQKWYTGLLWKDSCQPENAEWVEYMKIILGYMSKLISKELPPEC